MSAQALHCRLWSTTLLTLLAAMACKATEAPPLPETAAQAQPAAAKPDPGQVLAAAGVAITLPSTWTILAEDEPNFALARGPGEEQPTCTIELRRQGIGDLPKGARERDGDIDFTRGQLRARIRTLPGPSASSTVVISCLAPRAAQWGAIEAAFNSQTTASIEAAKNPSPAPAASPIAQLCAGTPAHQTYVCARRTDGAVFCGPSDGDTLTRIGGIPAAEQIGCEGARACSRSASGELHCWKADTAAQLVPEITEVRELEGGCVVDARGKAWCRKREDNGATSDSFAELVPFGNPAFALTDVEHVLAGTNLSQGCVLSSDWLTCWDHAGTLRTSLPNDHEPHARLLPAIPKDLAKIGDRVCTAGPKQWTCIDGEQRFELDSCEQTPCGCSLLGAMRLSCDHEPVEHAGALLGRIAGVVAVDGACAALVDGTVVCRGPVAGRVDDSPRVSELLVAGRSGVLHVLELREATEPSEPSQPNE